MNKIPVQKYGELKSGAGFCSCASSSGVEAGIFVVLGVSVDCGETGTVICGVKVGVTEAGVSVARGVSVQSEVEMKTGENTGCPPGSGSESEVTSFNAASIWIKPAPV